MSKCGSSSRDRFLSRSANALRPRGSSGTSSGRALRHRAKNHTCQAQVYAPPKTQNTTPYMLAARHTVRSASVGNGAFQAVMKITP